MFTFLSPTHLVIVIICMAIKGDLRESAIESRPPFQSDGIVGGRHDLMMSVMIVLIREAVKNYLADFFPLRGYPPTPLNGKSFCQKPKNP